MVVEDVTVDLVNWSLNLVKAQQALTAKNIANANVKGYEAKQIDFSNQLESLQSQSSNAALKAALAGFDESAPVTLQNADIFADQGVQLDKEIARSTEQSLKYQALIEGLNHHFGLMKVAISGRQ